MAVRTALLNGNNINLDSDFSKYVESLTSQGVISGFDMTTTSVGVGKAFVKCTRTNGETIMVYVENTESIAISGNGYIVIKVPQAMIDDGTNNPADGTGIATIELVETLPSANYMTLGQIVGGVLADVRYFIPKVQNIDSLLTRMDEAEADILALELLGIPDHLENALIVGEKYSSTNTEMFKQETPNAGNSTDTYNIGDTATNKQVHIQRIGSGTASNTITLKIKKVGSPTTTLHCDVYQGQKYDVSATESAWYGTGTALATSSKTYTNFSTSWQTITFTLNNSVGGTRGQLLDIVVYQEGNIVNASNYYQIACDTTQYSQAFRCIGVNGTTITPSYKMPYCVSDGFEKYLLCKYNTTNVDFGSETQFFSHANQLTTSYVNVGNITTVKGCHLTRVRFQANGSALSLKIGDYTHTDLPYGGGSAYVDRTINDYIGGGDVPVQMKANDNSSTYWVRNVTIYGYNFRAWSGDDPIAVGKPTTVENVGEIARIVIFGINQDNEFQVGLESSNATSGSITPGNFVGYLKIGKYKIPYYL